MPNRSSNTILIAIGALMLFLATLFGAYGAHGLRGTIDAQTWDAYQVAVDYQFYHGLGVVAAAMLAERFPKSRGVAISGWILLFGMIAFSGSIFATTFGAPDVIGGLAPVGGLGLMVGWLSLAFGLFTAR